MSSPDWRQLCAYTDRLSARHGEEIEVMAHCLTSDFTADIVRLGGRGREITPVKPLGTFSGRAQQVTPGSYVRLVESPWDRGSHTGGLRIEALLYLSSPTGGTQCIWSTWDDKSDAGYSLGVDAAGCLRFVLSQNGRPNALAVCATPLVTKEWYRVWGDYDATRQIGAVGFRHISRQDHVQVGPQREERSVRVEEGVHIGAGRVLIAARNTRGGPAEFFSGRIEAPQLSTGSPETRATIALWDFSHAIEGELVRDISGNGWHGETVNQPTRAVTGAGWSGSERDWRAARHAYAAIHFHPDDLGDCGWEPTLRVTIDPEWPTGIYAVKLRADRLDDIVPFWVRSTRAQRTAHVCVLSSTMTYLAYSNEQGTKFTPLSHTGVDNFIQETNMRSLYDRHSDGFGVTYASLLRPLTQFRPDYLSRYTGSPHCLNLDLRLLGFLTASGIECDVITDHDLHREGLDAVSGYQVLITGAHPEYVTERMIDALHRYVAGGGNLMYLGGNGLHGVVAAVEERPHILEIRRAESNGFGWQSPSGEHHHSLTGEFGGHWRRRNFPEHRFLGVGFTAVGNGTGRPYARVAAQPEYDWVFDGVVTPDRIGEYGDVLGAAASYEIDRADDLLGTPPETIVLATADGFSGDYAAYVDDVELDPVYSIPGDGEISGLSAGLDRVRADMTLIEGAIGGSVFSVGSIGWCGSLEHNDYENDVARITRNVLNRFLV